MKKDEKQPPLDKSYEVLCDLISEIVWGVDSLEPLSMSSKNNSKAKKSLSHDEKVDAIIEIIFGRHPREKGKRGRKPFEYYDRIIIEKYVFPAIEEKMSIRDAIFHAIENAPTKEIRRMSENVSDESVYERLEDLYYLMNKEKKKKSDPIKSESAKIFEDLLIPLPGEIEEREKLLFLTIYI